MSETKKILIVEDDKGTVTCVKDILGLYGIKAETATNGMEAVECYKKEKFDLILMDVTMPDMDGIEASRELRKISKDVKIFILTGYIDEYELPEDMKECIKEVFAKPFDFDVLIEKIKQHI